MTPGPVQPGGSAIRLYEGYRYTIVTFTNGAGKPPRRNSGEADPPLARWTYFRRQIAVTGTEAARQVESDFQAWVDKRLEAEGSGEC